MRAAERIHPALRDRCPPAVVVAHATPTGFRDAPFVVRTLVFAAVVAVVTGCSAAAPAGPTPEQARIIEQLGSVDRRLGADPSIAIKLTDRICAELKAGRTPAEVAADVRRFSSGEGVISLEQADRAIASARTNLCPEAR